LYLDMWEWLFWAGLITFFLLIVGAIFAFDFAVILVILFGGLGTMAWARFGRYPPLFEAYEHQLARQRYLARTRQSRPEATIRQKNVRRKGKRRQGRLEPAWRSSGSASAIGVPRGRSGAMASRARSSTPMPAASSLSWRSARAAGSSPTTTRTRRGSSSSRAVATCSWARSSGGSQRARRSCGRPA